MSKEIKNNNPMGKLLEPLDAGTYETGKFESLFSPSIYGENEPVYLIRSSYVGDILKSVEGRILTLIEASTDDMEKRDSLKSLVRQMVWQENIRLLRLNKVK